MVTITEVYKKISRHNRESGHSWTEYGNLLGYRVRGGFFCATFHRTLEEAEKEKQIRERASTINFHSNHKGD